MLAGSHAGDFSSYFVSFCLGLYFFFLVQLCLDAAVTVETRTGEHGRAEQREKGGLPALSLQPAGDNAPLLPRI